MQGPSPKTLTKTKQSPDKRKRSLYALIILKKQGTEDGNKWVAFGRQGSWQCSAKGSAARTCAGRGAHHTKPVHEATKFAHDSVFFDVGKTKVKGSRKPPCTK